MYKKETDIVENIVNETVNYKTITIKKTDEVKRISRAIYKEIKKLSKKNRYSDSYSDLLIGNLYVLEREINHIKRTYELKKYFISDETGMPVLLEVILNLLIEIKPEITAVFVNYMIECVQMHFNLQLEEFFSLVSFMKLALIKLCIESNDEDIIAYSLKSIKKCGEINTERLIESYCETEKLLNAEKAGVYPLMDNATKSYYRSQIETLSKVERVSEEEITRAILEKEPNQHVGFNIINNENFRKRREKTKRLYLFSLIVLPVVLSLTVAIITNNILASILLIFLFYEPSKILLDNIFLMSAKPLFVPRMKVMNELEEYNATASVFSCLMDKDFNFDKFKEQIVEEYHRAPKGEMYYILLCDLCEADKKALDYDEELIKKAKELSNFLNLELNGKFLLLIRKRKYSETMKKYIGMNRKRGAINDLCAEICGKTVVWRALFGNRSALKKLKYLILFDSDTKSTIGSYQKLIGAMEHPINKPVIKNGKLIKGNAVIAPSLGIIPTDTNINVFTQLFSYEKGISHYQTLKSDSFNDILGVGSFCGKGIIEVRSFYEITENLFKDEEVLSHDVLEGIALNCKTATDVQFLDGFPNSFVSYIKRNNRWIRGDFQNVLFLGKYIRNRNYQKIKNPFSQVSKLKLLENLLRALKPVITIILLLISAFQFGNNSRLLFFTSLITFVFSNISAFFFSLISEVVGGEARRIYNGLIPESIRNFFLIICEISLLPINAYHSIISAAKGAYRIIYSKNNLLEWQTAEMGDKMNDNPLKLAMPSIALALFSLLSFKRHVRWLCFFFLLSVPILLIFKEKCDNTIRKLNAETSFYLKKEAEKIWGFFEKYSTEEDNWLIPDNVSFYPQSKVAHKTSPTNIGLYLLSIYGAFRLEFITETQMNLKLERAIETIKKLEKFKGHLYNWYNTKTLEVLSPRFISTVDSGNFISSLIALKEGLSGEIKTKIEKLIMDTDFSFLYNETNNLFSIGFDERNNKLTENYYDNIMSECRTLSYIAVAKRWVPKEHWSALSRIYSSSGFLKGPISWSGTAFEYFMPQIFMPLYKNTFMFEGLRYALFCQIKSANKRKTPVGISESAFYSFDSEMNYEYKAHGVSSLSLQKGENLENVVSPYSTFLMMQTSLREMFKNYKRLTEMGLSGEFGLYEAVDFSLDRSQDSQFKIIKSYMAHHEGMSFLSIVNILLNDEIQRLFMKDNEIKSADELLFEKPPSKVSCELNMKPHIIKTSNNNLNAEPLDSCDITLSFKGKSVKFKPEYVKVAEDEKTITLKIEKTL